MSAKRILPKLVALVTFGLVMNLYAGSGSVAFGNGGCIAGSEPSAYCNVLEGSTNNSMLAEVKGGTIGGGGGLGFPNQVNNDFGTIGGGLDNKAGGRATVAGGQGNKANGLRSTVGGGFENTAGDESATVGGGYGNIAGGIEATVSGGIDNTASAWQSAIGGGSGNVASYHLATVAGGSYNTASSLDSTVGGGDYNESSGAYSTIADGTGNEASGLHSTIGGGAGNTASGDQGTASGGLGNRATDRFSTVGGGEDNLAGESNDASGNSPYSTVSSGTHNTANGEAATVPGGASNTAAGAYSLAAGRRSTVKSADEGAFLFADSNDFDFNSAAPNEFAVRATGGVRLVTAIDTSGNPSAGVQLPKGSGSWASLSDRNSKANFSPVDLSAILTGLMTIPITSWNYKTQDPSIRHIGPMAQDLAVFGFGEDDKHISTVDAEGIALAAIQALDQMVRAQDDRITAQQQEIATLKTEIVAQESRTATLETRIAALEQATGTRSMSMLSVSSNPVGDWLLPGIGLLGLTLSLLGRRNRQGAGKNGGRAVAKSIDGK